MGIITVEVSPTDIQTVTVGDAVRSVVNVRFAPGKSGRYMTKRYANETDEQLQQRVNLELSKLRKVNLTSDSLPDPRIFEPLSSLSTIPLSNLSRSFLASQMPDHASSTT